MHEYFIDHDNSEEVENNEFSLFFFIISTLFVLVTIVKICRLFAIQLVLHSLYSPVQ
jgi:hypothetical protein